MNKDNAPQYLPFIHALIEGKTIQEGETTLGFGWAKTAWRNCDNPTFDKPPECYRIKPEPREWWMNVYSTGEAYLHPSKEKADESGSAIRKFECIHVREVI